MRPLRCRSVSLACAFLLSLTLGACSGKSSAPSTSSTNSSADAERVLWETESAASEVKVDAAGVATLRLRAIEGYKINQDFPARVVASTEGSGLHLPQREIKGLFENKELLFKVPVEGRGVGEHTLSMVGDFSICLDDENGYCLLFNGKNFTSKVTVTAATPL
ncbi:MAG: hypothetical protein VYD19_02985 [Myxococcota bacterium]|nr:hypothetical protein [Myxococcota bacterium]